MNLTAEQEQIVGSSGSIRINAVAGSGKTTTLIEYAKSRPINSSILYLAFNKSVKDEAISKFREAGLPNVVVETAHSLAFRNIVIGGGYKVGFHSPFEIAQKLFRVDSPTVEESLLATHALNFAAFFCNSTVKKVEELDYRDTISENEKEELSFVEFHYDSILLYCRQYLAAMHKRQISMSHDFYLKLFQLNSPKLNFNYILFDEAQDASPVMVEIIKAQSEVTRIIVGDSHQQIYRWRYAVNSMEMFDFPQLTLSKSFRLTASLAHLAVEILGTKAHFLPHKSVLIEGVATEKAPINSRATIARTNISLLAEAIAFVANKRSDTPIYFEGHIKSYLFGDEGGSLSDVLNLHTGKLEYIRNQTIKQMSNIDELSDFAEKSGDSAMSRAVELVEKYGDKLPMYLAKLHKFHLEKEDREKAKMIFSTVHRCKGMEYDEVFLGGDFMSEKQLKSSIKPDGEGKSRSSAEELNEEVNLLYVAATRAKKVLHLPKHLLPEGVKFSDKSHVKVVATESSLEKLDKVSNKKPNFRTLKKSGVSSGSFWKKEDENYLISEYKKGSKIRNIAIELKRSRGAITSRLQRLNLDGML